MGIKITTPRPAKGCLGPALFITTITIIIAGIIGGITSSTKWKTLTIYDHNGEIIQSYKIKATYHTNPLRATTDDGKSIIITDGIYEVKDRE